MIYITGDTHGKHDIRKLNFKNFPESRSLCKDDYVIITGDFGFVWDGSNEVKYDRKGKYYFEQPYIGIYEVE